MSSVIFFPLHFKVALSLSLFVLILGEDDHFSSPELNLPSVLPPFPPPSLQDAPQTLVFLSLAHAIPPCRAVQTMKQVVITGYVQDDKKKTL